MPGLDHNTSSSSLFGRLSTRSSFISRKDVKVAVQLLHDEETIGSEFKRSAPAQDILDYVCECINLREKDYLGLRYQDHHKYRYWVDLSQPISAICKQLKSDSISLCLRFRYYPGSVTQIREELTRYQLTVQLQRDLLHGRLYCPQPVAAQLAALILQAQLGDYDEEKANGDRYVSEYKLLLKQTPKLEQKIAELHRAMKGMSAAEAEHKILELASQMETYGFDPYTIKDPKNPSATVYIGANHRGILVYLGSQKAHHIHWSEVAKIDYTGNELLIYPREGYEPLTEPLDSPNSEGSGSKHAKDAVGNGDISILSKGTATGPTSVAPKTVKHLRFVCPSRAVAKHLWVHLLSQKAFFNEASAELIKPTFSKPRIPLLTRGSAFRFPSQRVLKEIETSPIEERPEVSFSRYELPKQAPRQDPPTMTKYQTMSNLRLNGNVGNGGSAPTSATTHTETDAGSVKASTSLPINLADTPVEISSSIIGTSSSIIGTQSSTENDASSGAQIQTSPILSSFTASVHLFKYERARLENNNNDSPGMPLAQSTPKSNGGSGILKKEAASSRILKLEPGATNGKMSGESPSSAKSRRATIVNLLFGCLLLLLVLGLVAVAVFERKETAHLVESQAWLTALRYSYYQPTKDIILQKYAKMFAK